MWRDAKQSLTSAANIRLRMYYLDSVMYNTGITGNARYQCSRLQCIAWTLILKRMRHLALFYHVNWRDPSITSVDFFLDKLMDGMKPQDQKKLLCVPLGTCATRPVNLSSGKTEGLVERSSHKGKSKISMPNLVKNAIRGMRIGDLAWSWLMVN